MIITRPYRPVLTQQGYNLRVDDYLQAVRVEGATDVLVELVKLVQRARSAHVPQDTVVQHVIVGGGEGGQVGLVVVGLLNIVQRCQLDPSGHIVDLERHRAAAQDDTHVTNGNVSEPLSGSR